MVLFPYVVTISVSQQFSHYVKYVIMPELTGKRFTGRSANVRNQSWANCAPDADRARASAQNLWGAPNIDLYKKTVYLQICSQTNKTMKN